MLRMPLIVFITVLMLSAAQSKGTGLTLHRTLPPSQRIDLGELIHHDRARHARVVGDFSLTGNVGVGLYYTKVAVGLPPQLFDLQIDTGSDLTWISCADCSNCPRVTSLDIQLKFFNISNSTTATRIDCDTGCDYSVTYGDGSESSGYIVSDMLTLHPHNKSLSDSPAPILFGCTTSRVESVGIEGHFVDGIFGLGPGKESVVDQLSAQGITPRVFSHCLKGGDRGGGLLVMGEALHPNMVYTPLVPAQPYYTINLERIAVDGKSLPSAVFGKKNEGIIVDSGTTLTYFVEEIYESFVDAVSNHVSNHVKSYDSIGYLCYDMTTSEFELFPVVTLHFSGGASMVLRPDDYLYKTIYFDGFCLGIMKVQGDGIPILGDSFLRDKIVVYDLFQQRLGWSTNVNCTLQMKVNTSYGFSNDGEHCSSRYDILIATFLIYILLMISPQKALTFIEY